MEKTEPQEHLKFDVHLTEDSRVTVEADYYEAGEHGYHLYRNQKAVASFPHSTVWYIERHRES